MQKNISSPSFEKENHKLFLRKEFFGSILYNTFDKQYYFFDEETTQALQEIFAGNCYSEELQEFRKDLADLHLYTNDLTIIDRPQKDTFSSPLRVFIDITYLCNLRCKHCFTDSKNRKNDELTTQEIFSLLDQMHHVGSFLLSIAGGEPLLRKDLFEIIAYAKKQFIDVSMTTNALRITEDMAKKLHDLQLRTITVSIDGIEKNHDSIRGSGKFHQAIENIKLLRKHCKTAKISIKNTVNSQNLSDYQEIIKLSEDLSLDSVKFNPIRLFGRTENNRHLLITQRQYVRFLRDVQKIKTSIPVSIPKTPLDNRPYDFIPIGFGCTGGKETCNISPTGKFSACAFLGNDFVVGNIKTSPFINLWKKTNASTNYCGNETCKSCPKYMSCRGGCRSRALFQRGDINAVDPLCPLEKSITQEHTA